MQGHFVRSATREQTVRQAWSHLEQDARAQVAGINADLSGAAPDVRPTLEHYAGALSLLSTEHSQAVVVDPQWRVLAESQPVAPPAHPTPTRETLRWTPILDSSASDPALRRGTFSGEEGLQFGIARRLAAGDAWLVVYRSRAAVLAEADQAWSSLNAIILLTWLWTSLLLGIAAYLVVARLHEEAERQQKRALAEHRHQRQTLLRTRDAVVFGLAKLADSRDPDTGDHLERISIYSATLATALRHHPSYAEEIDASFLRLIGISSALHDIGKVGVRDSILLKPGPLTAEERDRIQAHAEIGGKCLREIEQRLGSSNFLQMARDIAFAHHERWDGTGYPLGLSGETIPLAARIVAVADVYDALSSRRVYKSPRSHDECVKIIADAAGTHFDPEIVRIWLSIHEKFRDVAKRYADASVATKPEFKGLVSPAQEAEFQADRGGLVMAGAGIGI